MSQYISIVFAKRTRATATPVWLKLPCAQHVRKGALQHICNYDHFTAYQPYCGSLSYETKVVVEDLKAQCQVKRVLGGGAAQ